MSTQIKKRLYQPKPAAYTPREEMVLKGATFVVVRALVDKKWREQVYTPTEKQTIRSVIQDIQHFIRHHRDLSKIIIYAAMNHEGERHIACIPHNEIPSMLTQK